MPKKGDDLIPKYSLLELVNNKLIYEVENIIKKGIKNNKIIY